MNKNVKKHWKVTEHITNIVNNHLNAKTSSVKHNKSVLWQMALRDAYLNRRQKTNFFSRNWYIIKINKSECEYNVKVHFYCLPKRSFSQRVQWNKNFQGNYFLKLQVFHCLCQYHKDTLINKINHRNYFRCWRYNRSIYRIK